MVLALKCSVSSVTIPIAKVHSASGHPAAAAQSVDESGKKKVSPQKSTNVAGVTGARAASSSSVNQQQQHAAQVRAAPLASRRRRSNKGQLGSELMLHANAGEAWRRWVEQDDLVLGLDGAAERKLYA